MQPCALGKTLKIFSPSITNTSQLEYFGRLLNTFLFNLSLFKTLNVYKPGTQESSFGHIHHTYFLLFDFCTRGCFPCRHSLSHQHLARYRPCMLMKNISPSKQTPFTTIHVQFHFYLLIAILTSGEGPTHVSNCKLAKADTVSPNFEDDSFTSARNIVVMYTGKLFTNFDFTK